MRTVDVNGLTVGDGHPPRVMSVLNVSTNSGYKPSVYLNPEEAVAFVERERRAGADIIDVGLQSANPKYDTEPPEVELDRLEDAARVIELADDDVIFSLETRYSEVAEEGIARGFDLINDVCGFADPRMPEVCEDHDVPVVKMASSTKLDRPGGVKTIDDAFEALKRGGFTSKTIIDPAFGGWYDGRTFEDNWELFRRLREFRAFKRPILTGTNREDFLGDLADQPETENQLAVSLAAATMEVERGAHVIRTHDTRETYDVVQVAHALGDERTISTEGPVNVLEVPGVTLREVTRHLDLANANGTVAAEVVTRSFVVGELGPVDMEELRTAGSACGVLVAESGDDTGTFVTGTVANLRRLSDDIVGTSESLTEVAGSIRDSLARSTNSTVR